MLKIRYIGVSIRDAGSIWVTKNVNKKPLCPGTLYRPMPYAEQTPNPIERIMDRMAMTKLFFREERKSASVKFFTHGSTVKL